MIENLTQEKINKLYSLLNELQSKKQQLEQELNEIEVEKRVIEENIKQIESRLENEYGIKKEQIEDFLNQKIQDLDKWIEEAEEILNQV